MGSGNQLIKKTFYGVLAINAFGLISGMMCVIIDAVVTGQFLGTKAVIAAGLISPVALLCNMLCNLLGPGVSIIGTRYMGMAKPKRCSQVFSVVMVTDLVFGGIITVLMFALSPAIAQILGGESDVQVLQMTSDYIRGFSFSLVPMCMRTGMSGIMMVDNDPKRAPAAMFVTLASDVVFDLANVLIFHGGMLGMALATSMSNFLGLFILLTHFFRKNRVVRFTLEELRLGDLREVALCGISAVISMGSNALRTLLFNLLLLSVAGSAAVAALSVANSVFSLVTSLALSMLITTATMSSMLYGSEDRSGLLTALSVSMRTAVMCFAVLSAVVTVFSGSVARLFLDSSATTEAALAARLIRLMSLQYLFSSVSYCLCGAYQGTKQLKLNYVITLMRECILPILSCITLGLLFGFSGFGIGFPVAGGLTLAACFIVLWKKTGKFPASVEDLLLLPEGFGAKPEDLFEAEMRTMDDVLRVSSEVMDFCKSKGAPGRTALMTALFVEEMGGNTVRHGFSKKRRGCIDLRLVYNRDTQIIRLRDDGEPFDPVDWLERNQPEDPAAGVGIRMLVGLAKDVSYIPAMGMNNLIILI